MTIYIDLLFILNFIYDFLLLMTVSVALKRNISIKRLLLGALVGALTTFIVLLRINKYILLLLKIIMGIIMIIVTYNYKNIKYFIINSIYLYMCSVILAGFIYFLKIEFNNLSYIIILLLGPLILYLYIKEERKLKEVVNLYRKVTIFFNNNKCINLNGFIDSGNRLVDPVTKKYIVLVNKKVIDGIYNIRSPMYVVISSVNKTSLLTCIKIKKIVIDNITYNNYLLGIIDNSFNSDYDCLLNYHLLEDNNV